MNHDATHCLDYRSYCPKKCYRAQLTEDLKHRNDLVWLPVSWMHLLGTAECERKVRKEVSDDA